MSRSSWSEAYIIDMVKRGRKTNIDNTGHIECPLCKKGSLFYYFETNGRLGGTLHVHCNREDCLPLSALRLKDRKNGN